MAIFLSDQDIYRLLRESKHLPADYKRQMQLKAKPGHSGFSMDVPGAQGSRFRVYGRRAHANPLNFSVILGYCVPGSNQVFRLRRYNGKSHEHTNPIEKQKHYDFHVHTATARYQERGSDEETFAEVTDRYADYAGAVRCMIEDCGFIVPEEEEAAGQLSLLSSE